MSRTALRRSATAALLLLGALVGAGAGIAGGQVEPEPGDPPPVDAAYRVERDLAYHAGPGADPLRQRLDLYVPVPDRGAPAVLFLHAGGWRGGSRSDR